MKIILSLILLFSGFAYSQNISKEKEQITDFKYVNNIFFNVESLVLKGKDIINIEEDNIKISHYLIKGKFSVKVQSTYLGDGVFKDKKCKFHYYYTDTLNEKTKQAIKQRCSKTSVNSDTLYYYIPDDLSEMYLIYKNSLHYLKVNNRRNSNIMVLIKKLYYLSSNNRIYLMLDFIQ